MKNKPPKMPDHMRDYMDSSMPDEMPDEWQHPYEETEWEKNVREKQYAVLYDALSPEYEMRPPRVRSGIVENNEKMVRPKELASMLNITRKTLYKRIEKGLIPEPMRDSPRFTYWPMWQAHKIKRGDYAQIALAKKK